MKSWMEILGRVIGKAEGILAKEGGRSGEKMGISRMGKGKGGERGEGAKNNGLGEREIRGG